MGFEGKTNLHDTKAEHNHTDSPHQTENEIGQIVDYLNRVIGSKGGYGSTKHKGHCHNSHTVIAEAFLIANDDELSGKRPKGYFQIVERHSHDNADLSVEIRKPDLLTPLVIVGNGRGALIGAWNPNVYKRLVTSSPDNEYKLLVRQITEEDLRDAR